MAKQWSSSQNFVRIVGPVFQFVIQCYASVQESLTDEQPAEQDEDQIAVVGEQEADHVAADHRTEPAGHQYQTERHCPSFSPVWC